MFKFITTKPLWVNITVGVLSLVVLVLFFFISLGWITGHGKYDKVPDIVGQNVFAAINNLQSKGFKVVVSDSVYSTVLPKLTITKQIPEGDAQVKHGRTIYLTVNRAVPPNVQVPSLVGFSFKSAQLYLQSMGLKLGDTTYRHDYAKNFVLDQLLNRQTIKPGTEVPLGTAIGLVLGTGESDSAMNVPDVVGLTLQQAKSRLKTLGLSVQTITAEGNVNDSLSAFVIRQNPSIFKEAIEGQKTINKIHQGSTVDLVIGTIPPVKDSTNTYPQ